MAGRTVFGAHGTGLFAGVLLAGFIPHIFGPLFLFQALTARILEPALVSFQH